MRKTLIAAGAALALALGCSSGTPCDEAAAIQQEAFVSACADRTCNFCACIRAGQVESSTGTGCMDPPPAPECTGSTRTNAEECVNNRFGCEIAAGLAAATTVGSLCPSE